MLQDTTPYQNQEQLGDLLSNEDFTEKIFDVYRFLERELQKQKAKNLVTIK